MVGHTGALDATRMAVEVVDLCLGRLVDAVTRADGVLLVTADHGNADQMWMRTKAGDVSRDEDGIPVPRTSHSLNRVPFVVYDPRGSLAVVEGDHGLAAIGTTLIELCGLVAPEGYVGGLVVPSS
jgi:2,3-bisphosphoglycerate-independent phosphoglycerate mutase